MLIMREKRVPIRTCVICRKRRPKQELARHVCPVTSGQARETKLLPDPGQILPGRGFYVCSSEPCATRFASFRGWRAKCKGVFNDG